MLSPLSKLHETEALTAGGPAASDSASKREFWRTMVAYL